MEEFKINVEGIRGQLHITQDELAKRLNMSVRTLQNKMRGKAEWSYNEVSLLAQMVGVPISNIDTKPIIYD